MGEEKKDQKDPHCLYGPTQKHAFYLGVVGVVLEGVFFLHPPPPPLCVFARLLHY